ncbi:MAG TPA: YlbF family regulator [Clostridiales bacterium]|nr:YlbF family regulator [Clostridiales bacterium]
MDTVELAREIGRQIQNDEAYVQLKVAQQNSDEDKELQDLIGEFNLKRMAINNEASKTDRDDTKMQELNQELRDSYSKIMENENMIAYNVAKQELDTIVQRVVAIISQSAEGEDPNTTDYTPSCGGSCSSCSGCH